MSKSIGDQKETVVLPVFVCKKCGYRWIPRIPNPKYCPWCKQPLKEVRENDKREV